MRKKTLFYVAIIALFDIFIYPSIASSPNVCLEVLVGLEDDFGPESQDYSRERKLQNYRGS